MVAILTEKVSRSKYLLAKILSFCRVRYSASYLRDVNLEG